MPGTALERDREVTASLWRQTPVSEEKPEPLRTTMIHRKTYMQPCPAATLGSLQVLPPPKPRQDFSLTRYPKQVYVLRESWGIWTIYFLVDLLFPASPILSSPTQTKAPDNIKTSGIIK